MENQSRNYNAQEIKTVMENITYKMAQIKHMFPHYHEVLGDTYQKIQSASLK